MRCGKAILGVMLGTAMVLGTAARPAAADTITATFFGAQWEVVGSTVRMIYQVSFANTDSQMIPAAAFFTIYNFEGFQPLSMQFSQGPDGQTTALDWAPSSQLTGITPIGVNPDDNALVPNLTWTYSGGITGIITTTGTLGYFSAVTDVLTSAFKDRHFASLDSTNTVPPGPNEHLMGLRVPDSTSPTPTVIPLPLAVWGGLALFGMVGVMKARRRHS